MFKYIENVSSSSNSLLGTLLQISYESCDLQETLKNKKGYDPDIPYFNM